MDLKEKIMNLPAWKAGVIALSLVLGGVYIIEVIIVGKVFYLLESGVSKFETMFKDEDRKNKEDYARWEKEYETSKKRSQENDLQWNERMKTLDAKSKKTERKP